MAETVTIRLGIGGEGKQTNVNGLQDEEGRHGTQRQSHLQLDVNATKDQPLDCPGQSYQGPHDWRKRLKPVKSPIKLDGIDVPFLNR